LGGIYNRGVELNEKYVAISFDMGTLKGALNPNFLNLTIRREKFWLYKRYGFAS